MPSKARDRRAYQAAYYRANREQVLAAHAAYRQAHREQLRAANAAYARANPEKVRESKAAYRRANEEKERASNAARYQASKELCKARAIAWVAANPEKHKASVAAWAAKNPEALATYKSRRRARKAGNGGSHTTEQRRIKFDELGNRCFYCGIAGPMTIDHQTPLSRGGTDDIDNIVPACRSCNSRKGTKTADEYAAI